MLASRFQNTPLSDLFFSELNIDALQQGIRYSVYSNSNGRHTIGKQDDRQLMLVMRSVFLQFGPNRPAGVVEQVRCLNKMVLDFCVPRVLREIEMYQHYINDIHNLPVPMERSTSVSSAGSRALVRESLG